MYDTPDPLASLRLLFWGVAIVQSIAFAVAGSLIAERRGYAGGLGLALGLLLSALGVVILWSLPEKTDDIERRRIDDRQAKRCPECAEVVRYRAKVCRWCGHRFEEATRR